MARKDDAADVARAGFDAMMRGERDIAALTGLKNKIRSSVANVIPAAILAKQHPENGEAGDGQEIIGEMRFNRSPF